MMALSWQADHRASAILVCLALFQAAAVALTGLSQRWLVDAAGLGTIGGIAAAVAVGSFAHATLSAGGRIRTNLQYDMASRVDVKVNEQVLDTVNRIPTIEHLENPEYLDKLTALRAGTRALSGIGWGMAETITALASILLSLWLLLAVHPVLGLLAPMAMIPFWTSHRGEKMVLRARYVSVPYARRENALHQMFTTPEDNKEIKISGAGPQVNSEATEAWDQVGTIILRAELRSAMWKLAGWACYTGGFIAALSVVAYLASRSAATLGDLVLVLALGARMRWQVRYAADSFDQLSEGGQIAEHFMWLNDFAAQHSTSGLATPPAPLRHGIRLRGVSFSYPGATSLVLKDIDLTLRPGSTIALVGDNGVGKTTLVKLITGVYTPTMGHIEIDGVPSTSIDPDAWRACCSGAFQDFVKFELPVREAVAIGRIDPPADADEVVDALRRAGALSFSTNLPHGLDTQLGHNHAGVDLSHGQWQRLALARGLVRQDTSVLVLDEPTAALDPQAEHDLYEEFAKVAHKRPGRVTLLVSHRFSTVHMADQIVVLVDGRVAEQGTHHELMEKRGRYAELFTTQARGYGIQHQPDESAGPTRRQNC
ncbi:ABC transporter ATP-binding protein [Nocardia sp. NPDC051321]|uniref:ABC transporter ATP-binding protein n=1 Tax=Nocardia sp. NPDC051321 TaxID=3364323 RepID=UPI003799BF18